MQHLEFREKGVNSSEWGAGKSLRRAAAFTGARREQLRGMFWENYRDGELLIARSGMGLRQTERAARARRRSQSFRNWPPNSRRIAHASENRKQDRSFPDFIAVNIVLVDKNCRGLIEGPQNIKLSPNSGPVGTVVTITGQNLGDMSSSASTVTFIDLSMSLTVVFHQ